MLIVTGAAPRTLPFQSTMPPAGLVWMVICCGGGTARAAEVLGAGLLGPAHPQIPNTAARTSIDAGSGGFFIPRKIF
jgi:hypothetical protein